MTEPGDPVSRRYRELAREEPPAHADAAILAAARGRTAVTRATAHGGSGVRPRFSNWMGPVSIAAVLVLGIGVSLRMQLEQPGVETSTPPPAQSEYSLPAAPPEPVPEAARDAVAPGKQAPAEQARMKEDRMAIAAPKPKAQLREAPAAAAGAGVRSDAQAVPPSEPNPFADAPVVVQQAPSGAATPATTLGAAPPPEEKSRAKLSADFARAPAPASVAPPPAAVVTAPATAAPVPAPAAPVAAPAAAPQASAAPPPPAMPAARAASPALAGALAPQPKREAYSANTAERELKKSIGEGEADPDPARELERIAKLREAGAQREADRALEAFRRRHPDYRIPEAMWARVKPR